MIRSMFAFVILVLVSGITAQEPLTSDNPPAIVIQADAFGSDSVVDSLQSLRSNIDKAQEQLDSLMPVSNFVSAAHRAAFYKAASDMKRANLKLFTYMAQIDPDNRLSWLQKAQQSKRQSDLAMVEYYKALPSEVPVIEHHKLKISSN